MRKAMRFPENVKVAKMFIERVKKGADATIEYMQEMAEENKKYFL